MPYEDWYSLVDDSDELFQGDLLPACHVPIVTPTSVDIKAEDEVLVDILTVNLTVLTQTCDLEHENVDSIVLARYDAWDGVVAAEIARGNKFIESSKFRKLIVDGALTNYFLLPPDTESPQIPWSVVNFRSLYTLPKAHVKAKAKALGKRRRIGSPYREALSQGFARFAMRVAFFQPLDAFESYSAQPVATAVPQAAVQAAPAQPMLPAPNDAPTAK